MKYVILFEDNEDSDPTIRSTQLPKHLAYLQEHAKLVESAGPLLDHDGSPAGGLWIVNADEHFDMTKLIEEDPFWPTGLRKSVKIRRWHRVFANGKVL